MAANIAAYSSAACQSDSVSSQTRARKPARSASSASIARPVNIMSITSLRGSARTSGATMIIGNSPIRTSGIAKLARRLARTTSHMPASPMPPAYAGPSTTATSGFGARSASRCSSTMASGQAQASSAGSAASSFICRRSPPAENDDPSAAIATERTSSWASASRSAARRASESSPLSGFRSSGRLRVSTAIEPRRETTTGGFAGSLTPGSSMRSSQAYMTLPRWSERSDRVPPPSRAPVSTKLSDLMPGSS